MSVLRVPASVLLDVREALLSLLHDALEEIGEPLTRPEREHHPEWFVKGREDAEGAWLLLDHIGWPAEDEETDAELDLSEEHTRMILLACTSHAQLYETWEEEADASDAARRERGEAPRKAEILRRGQALREFVSGLEKQLAATSP